MQPILIIIIIIYHLASFPNLQKCQIFKNTTNQAKGFVHLFILVA